MNLTRPNKIVLALAGVWMAAFAVHAGCESSPNLGAFPGVGDIRSDIVIDAQFARAPMFVAPDSLTQRTNYIDVSSEVPADGATVHFELPADSVAFQVDAIDADMAGDMEIELVVSAADSRSAPIRKSAGTMRLERDVSGDLRVIQMESPMLGHDIVSLLGGGEVGINVVVKSNIFGTVFVDGAKIRVGFGGIRGNSNDNTAGNSNDNTGDDNGNDNSTGNKNDNTGDDSGNDNTAGNTNDNAGDDFGDDDSAGNMNDNTGDDSGNDNTTGNTNDNTGDDSGNDNTTGNTNDNTGDDSGNDNTTGNTNDNTGDDSGNDNTAGNTNDNTGDGNGNDNTGDNSNDNTDDNSNDNSSAGLCSDGSLQVRADVEGPGGIGVDARYSEHGPVCKRFRLEIEGFATGWYDVFVNDVFVGEIFADSDDGEGEIRLETDDGNFPEGFPAVAAGDVVSVGDVIDVVLQTHCSEAFSCSNSNGNDNTGNDNTGGNTNDNGA